MVFQHLIAGLADLGTILLKAGQNDQVTLVHHCTAVTLNVARASLLLLRCAAALLGNGPVETDSDNRVSAKKNLRIVFLHSNGREFQPNST